VTSLLVSVRSQGSGAHRHLGERVEVRRVLAGLPAGDAVVFESRCNAALRLNPSGRGQGAAEAQQARL